MKILLINGPNLNLLGTRQPEVYGKTTLKDIEKEVQTYFEQYKFELECFQSNHEGALIDFLHKRFDADFAIINPGAYTHTSIALRDAFSATEIPFIEVHISNIFARSEFRHHSYLSPIAQGCIIGCGTDGYRLAASMIANRLNQQ